MPNPTDALIGKKIKQFRLLSSMSQECLAKELGITFQQVQKYEKGINRISASRLQDIAAILKRKVEEFFEGMGDFEKLSSSGVSSLESPQHSEFGEEEAEYADSRELLSLLKVYSKIKNHRVRSTISSLAKAMLSQQDEASEQ